MVVEVSMLQGLSVVCIGLFSEVFWLAIGIAVGVLGRYIGRLVGEYLFDGAYVVDDFDEEFWDGVPTGMMCALISGLTAFCCSIVVTEDSDRWYYCGATNAMLFSIILMGNAAFSSESMLAMSLFVLVFAGCAFGLCSLLVGDSLIAAKHREL
jgi:hypothetical protein